MLEGQVHVWRFGADETASDEVPESRLIELLSPDERERSARFVFPRDRARFVRAHAALRLVLSRYLLMPASAIVFESNVHGRPEVAHPRSRGGVRFNLSHTTGAIALAVCERHDIGVDVEWHARPMHDLHALADRFFSPVEARAVAAAPAARRSERFFEYWTLKESYIKARGLGLALPLDRFSFEFAADSCEEAPRISFAPDLGDDSRAWTFQVRRDASGHTLAVAVRSEGRRVRFVSTETGLPDLLGQAS